MSSKTARKKPTILFLSATACYFCCVRELHRSSLQLGVLKYLEEDAKQKKKKGAKISIYDCKQAVAQRHFGNSLCFCELKLSEN